MCLVMIDKKIYFRNRFLYVFAYLPLDRSVAVEHV